MPLKRNCQFYGWPEESRNFRAAVNIEKLFCNVKGGKKKKRTKFWGWKVSMIEFHLLREWIKSIVLETSVSRKKNGYEFLRATGGNKSQTKK